MHYFNNTPRYPNDAPIHQVELYVESLKPIAVPIDTDLSAFVFELVARRRRDVSPFTAWAGDYIVQYDNHHHELNHVQLVDLQTVFKLARINDIKLMPNMIYDAWSKDLDLINSADNCAFTTDLIKIKNAENPANLPSYRVNTASIQQSDFEMDFDKYERIWNFRANSFYQKLMNLYRLAPDHVLEFKQRTEYPKGQYSAFHTNDDKKIPMVKPSRFAIG